MKMERRPNVQGYINLRDKTESENSELEEEECPKAIGCVQWR